MRICHENQDIIMQKKFFINIITKLSEAHHRIQTDI